MRVLICSFLFLFILSCSSNFLIDSKDTKEGKSAVVHIYSQDPDDQIEYAKNLSKQGKYEKAIKIYLDIYNNKDVESEYQEEALFNIGLVYSNVFNYKKDFKKSIFYLEKLLEEFPKTKFREKAETKIENIKRIEEQRFKE